MKILDTSIIIALFSDINRPDLFDKILELGHELKITSHVMSRELLYDDTFTATCRFIKQGKFRMLDINSIKEIKEFRGKYQELGLGESDSMLACQKLDGYGENVYCILDDKNARRRATELDIKHTGLLGLLQMLKNKNIMKTDEFDHVILMLKKYKFRLLSDNK